MAGVVGRITGIATFLGILLVLAAGGYYLVTGEFDLAARILVGLGAALLVYAALERPESVEKAVTGRGIRFGGNAVVLTVAVVGILVLANYIAANRPQRWDWTRNQEFTLSPATIQLLGRIQQPTRAVLFFEAGNPSRQRAEDLIKEYVARTDKLTYEVVDPDLNPGLAQQAGIRAYGTVVFWQGDKKQETTTVSESAFTSALLRVVNPTQRKVYFVTGHEEKDITQQTRDGASAMRDILQRDGYQVEPLTIAVSGTIPSDASAIVIAGPRRPLLDQERDAVNTYLQNGGRAVIMLEPRTETGLEETLAEFGVNLKPGVAVDPRSSLQGDPTALAMGTPTTKYLTQAIVQPLRALTILPFMGWVGRSDNPPQGTTVSVILQTSDSGWLESDPQQAQFDEGKDVKGPVPVAVAVERRAGGVAGQADQGGVTSRIVVFGGSTWVQNQLVAIGQAQNADLFANSVSWATESEELLSIRPKDTPPDQLTITGLQANFVLASSIIFLPLLILIAGGVVWWNRR